MATASVEKADTLKETVDYVTEAIKQLEMEQEQVANDKHPEFQRLLATLDATRLRLLSVAEIQYQLSIQHAKHTMEYTKAQIEADFLVARDDIKDKLYNDLRRRRKEIRDLIDKLAQHGITVEQELVDKLDTRFPARKRTRENSRSQRPEFNLKLSEHEIREDTVYIQSLRQENSSK
ncbi:Hypothetical protein GLP15_2852 [Giardia lamblia P15]|uniref:Uncharacterized protein n=1 Tax=Giardia intestinalis (strain P15) TaxID=658858 RepID=E1F1V8_GIAIA|nr:Hypothetical protein GLP15_2852 [Giardia lamblia P15]